MRIAILGTRGIPARYGGFETFAEELSWRLAERGHHVTVYARQRHSEPVYRGVHLRYIPAVRHKYLETVAHTFVCTLDLLFHRYDALLYCNAANAVFSAVPRLLGMPVALNVDGLERNRKKWNRAARTWYLVSEKLATIFPTAVISDARKIADYYMERYRKPTRFIPYGAETGRVSGRATLDALGLEPSRYFLYVSRLEPENNALLVRQCFERLSTTMKLALIGDAPYAEEYIASVRHTQDSRVILPGAIYGEGYKELGSNCFAYIHATEVGGTHPALIEAMGRGALVLFLNTPENAEVAQGAGIPFEHDNLTAQLESVLAMSEAEREQWRQRARARIEERYCWARVTDAYENLFFEMSGQRR